MTVIDEDLTGSGEAFSHLDKELGFDAVARVHAFPCSGNGTFVLPAGLES